MTDKTLGAYERHESPDYADGGVAAALIEKEAGESDTSLEDARQYHAARDERQRLGRLVEEVRDGGHTVQVGRVIIAPCDEHGRTRAEVTALVNASRAAGERDTAIADRDTAEHERDAAVAAHAEAARTLTAREHLDAAWDAAHVPADGIIPAGAGYLWRSSKTGRVVQGLPDEEDASAGTGGIVERRLLDPPTPARPEGAEEIEAILADLPDTMLPATDAGRADLLASRGVRVVGEERS